MGPPGNDATSTLAQYMWPINSQYVYLKTQLEINGGNNVNGHYPLYCRGSWIANINPNLGATGRLNSGGAAVATATNMTLDDITAWFDAGIICRAVYASSDLRLKKDVMPILVEDGIRFVNSVDPVHFGWKDANMCKTRRYGYIAQDVLKKEFGGLVTLVADADMKPVDGDDGVLYPEGYRLTLDYEKVVPILHVAIRSIMDDVASLRREIADLKSMGQRNGGPSTQPTSV